MVILACGTSYYAGLVAKNFLQEIADLEVAVEIASEYRYQKNFYSDDMVVLAISQSGETADTIAALKEVQKKGIMTLGV
ncbi:MAG: SIS domain-containing protein, partial [Patescibacteria group bacterium]|nr:SIS domain-containing protein [Patescibacteria group bacterium]